MSETYEKKACTTRLETYEWDEPWWHYANKTGIPRVAYIGDSISVGTRNAATEIAEDKILFDGFGTSKAVDNPDFCEAIRQFIAQQNNCDLIMFNCGLHGAHLDDETEYKAHYEKMVCFLMSEYKDIPLVLLLSTATANEARNNRVLARNKAVVEVAQKYSLPVVDLYKVTDANRDLLSDGVHYTKEGYKIIAKELVDCAKAILGDKTVENSEPPVKTPMETYEWDSNWWDHAGTEGAPRVFYIGDSISAVSRRRATKAAEEKIYFDGFATSKALDHPDFCEAAKLVSAQMRNCDIVMFNNGLHGFHLEDETAYREHYENMIRFLQSYYKDIPLVLLLTTTVAREEMEPRVVVRNKVVSELARKYSLPVVDLYKVTVENKQLLSDDGIHWTEEGYAVIAKELVACAKSILADKGVNV